MVCIPSKSYGVVLWSCRNQTYFSISGTYGILIDCKPWSLQLLQFSLNLLLLCKYSSWDPCVGHGCFIMMPKLKFKLQKKFFQKLVCIFRSMYRYVPIHMNTLYLLCTKKKKSLIFFFWIRWDSYPRFPWAGSVSQIIPHISSNFKDAKCLKF